MSPALAAAVPAGQPGHAARGHGLARGRGARRARQDRLDLLVQAEGDAPDHGPVRRLEPGHGLRGDDLVHGAGHGQRLLEGPAVGLEPGVEPGTVHRARRHHAGDQERRHADHAEGGGQHGGARERHREAGDQEQPGDHQLDDADGDPAPDGAPSAARGTSPGRRPGARGTSRRRPWHCAGRPSRRAR